MGWEPLFLSFACKHSIPPPGLESSHSLKTNSVTRIRRLGVKRVQLDDYAMINGFI